MAFLAKGAQGQNKEGNRELMAHRASGHTVEAGVTLMPGGHSTQDEKEEEACGGRLLCRAPSALGQRGPHLLQQAAEQHGVTALAIHRHGALTLGATAHTAQACGEGRPPPSPGAQASLEF